MTRVWLWRLALVVALAVAALEARDLFRFAESQARIPKWDMAKNGWQGHQLALDLAHGRPLSFLAHLNDHERFPLGFSLLVVPFSLAAGPSYTAPTLVPAVSFALTPLLLLLAARRLDDGPVGWWGGLLAVALFLTSPLLRLLAVLIMREIPGVLFTLVAALCYLRALERGTDGSWRLAGVAALFLFFLKYNYGLSWLVAAGLHQVWLLPAQSRRRLAVGAREWLWPWFRPGWARRLFAAVLYALAALYLLDSNPGGVIYVLMVLATVALAVRWRTLGRPLVERVRRLPPPVRAAVWTVGVPVWIWCLSPDPVHPRAVLGFLRNRSSELPWSEALAYYPRSFLVDYLTHPLVGVAVLVGFAAALARARRGGPSWRLLSLLAVLALLLTVAHPYKQTRFLATTVPLVFLLAGAGFALLLFGGGNGAPARRWLGHAGAAVALAGVLFAAAGPRSDQYLRDAYRRNMGEPGLERVLRAFRRLAADDRRVGVIGTFNELSPPLAEWTLHQRPVAAGFSVVRALPRLSPGASEAEVARRLGRWLERRRPEEILVISVREGGERAKNPGFLAFDAGQQTAARRMLADPGWRVAGSRSWPKLGIDLRVLRPESPADSP